MGRACMFTTNNLTRRSAIVRADASSTRGANRRAASAATAPAVPCSPCPPPESPSAWSPCPSPSQPLLRLSADRIHTSPPRRLGTPTSAPPPKAPHTARASTPAVDAASTTHTVFLPNTGQVRPSVFPNKHVSANRYPRNVSRATSRSRTR